MSSLLLTADDFTKGRSHHWPRRCICQWIEGIFGHDDDVCDEAYRLAFQYVNALTGHDCLNLIDWASSDDVSYEDIAACWNSMAREITDLYGDRMVSPRQEELCKQS